VKRRIDHVERTVPGIPGLGTPGVSRESYGTLVLRHKAALAWQRRNRRDHQRAVQLRLWDDRL